MTHPSRDVQGATVLSEAERNRLVEEHLPLVHHVLGRLNLRLPPTLDREDLLESGVLGLMNAASTYNPSRGATFKTHAFVNVRGAILDEVRRHDVIPRSRRDRVRQVTSAEKLLAEELGRKPTAGEIALETGLEVPQVEEILLHGTGMTLVSTEDPAGGEASTRLLDGIAMASSPNPLEETERRELLERLMDAIKTLPERDRRVLVLYYGQELRLKEIGSILDITESRVSQIHGRATEKLYELLRDRGRDAEPAREQKPAPSRGPRARSTKQMESGREA